MRAERLRQREGGSRGLRRAATQALQMLEKVLDIGQGGRRRGTQTTAGPGKPASACRAEQYTQRLLKVRDRLEQALRGRSIRRRPSCAR